MEDSDIKRILDKFFQKDQSGKYQYSYYTGKKGYTASRAVIKMLGIYTDDTDRITGRTEFYYERFENIVYTILTILNGINVLDEPPQGTQVNNFLLLMPHNNADMVLINDPSNINMFGEVGYIVYDGNTYAVPRLLLDTNVTDTLLYARFMGMLMFLMRYAQTEGAKGSAKMKINRRQIYDSTAFTNTVGNAMKGKEGPPIKPVDRYIPPIQPETGQTEDVRPDANLQLYYNTMKTETPDEDFNSSEFIPGPDPYEEELLEAIEQNEATQSYQDIQEQLRQLDEQITREEIRQLEAAIIVEDRIAAKPEQVAEVVLNELEQAVVYALAALTDDVVIGEVELAREIEEEPIRNILLTGAMSGDNIGELLGMFFETRNPVQKKVIRKTIKDELKKVLNNNNGIFKNNIVTNTFRQIATLFMGLDRGFNNINIVGTIDNLTIVDEESIKKFIFDSIEQVESLTTLLVSLSAGVSVLVIKNVLLGLLGRLFDILGITSYISYVNPGINVERYRIIKDANGKTISVTNMGEANFFPDPISGQTAFEVISNPEGYIINKILPSGKQVQEAKSTFDVGLYNFIGNRLLSISELNKEPTFTQPGYSLLTNISTEIDSLYTSITQGDVNAIKVFSGQYKNFLRENKDVIVNLVNQPYFPGDPDDDPEEDDDISSGSSGSPFPKKPNKFVDSKQGEWYIMKTLIYWLMRHLSKTYEYTSVHMQNLFLVSQEIATSIFTTLVGRHPYLITSGIALTLLKPQFVLDIFDLFVVAFRAIMNITKSVLTFFSSPTGLVMLGVGTFILLLAFARSNKKFSLF